MFVGNARHSGIEGAMMYMYAQPGSIAQFTMLQTYGLEKEGAPALIIDNIPIGQHIAKYRFPYSLARGLGLLPLSDVYSSTYP
jgi:hypothetical protein